MCLAGFLAELLCCIAESVEEFEEVKIVVEEIEQFASAVDEVKKISSSNEDLSNSDCHQSTQSDAKSMLVKNIVGAAIQANPTVSAIKNTLGAIKDYRNGEEISDIVKERTVQMVEDQVPSVVLKHAEA
ncbi:uncharacterized protein LOC129574033 [Sitodiplosis mosellana]|uniref:uncharacterized protein LOC129574033 n=1 Tax=Sitodiplosis mosellana TaxID=263140 RepID=UPI002444CBD8|nr:uncharacterized protein LOC129574033 [Sitodiplosis mosellana]